MSTWSVLLPPNKSFTSEPIYPANITSAGKSRPTLLRKKNSSWSKPNKEKKKFELPPLEDFKQMHDQLKDQANKKYPKDHSNHDDNSDYGDMERLHAYLKTLNEPSIIQ